MSWLIENWSLLITFMIILLGMMLITYWFIDLITEKQKTKVKEWLVWACIEAEKLLQSGTGQLKLREVWNLFCEIPAFTWIAKLISFATFSIWVSDALKTVKTMLVSNKTLAE